MNAGAKRGRFGDQEGRRARQDESSSHDPVDEMERVGPELHQRR